MPQGQGSRCKLQEGEGWTHIPLLVLQPVACIKGGVRLLQEAQAGRGIRQGEMGCDEKEVRNHSVRVRSRCRPRHDIQGVLGAMACRGVLQDLQADTTA